MLAGVGDGFPNVIVLELELGFEAHAGDAGQRHLRLVLAHDVQNLGQVAAAERAVGVVERHPILLGEHGNVERVAGDHFQIERDVRVLLPDGGDHGWDIEEAFTQRDFRQQEAVFIRLHSHVFDVARKDVRQQQPQGLGRLFAERYVVAEIEVDAHPFAAHALQPRGLLGGAPAFVVLDTQTHLVYIAYEYPSLVVAFDPGSGKVRWHTTIGDTPTDVQVDSTNHHVYVASTLFRSRQDLLAVLDGATGKALLTAPTGLGDNGIAVDTKRQRVYVSSTDNPIINVFKLVTSPTGTLSAESSILAFGPRPQALGVNSRLGRLYVGDAIENTITVYDEDTGRKLATIPVADGPLLIFTA